MITAVIPFSCSVECRRRARKPHRRCLGSGWVKRPRHIIVEEVAPAEELSDGNASISDSASDFSEYDDVVVKNEPPTGKLSSSCVEGSSSRRVSDVTDDACSTSVITKSRDNRQDAEE